MTIHLKAIGRRKFITAMGSCIVAVMAPSSRTLASPAILTKPWLVSGRLPRAIENTGPFLLEWQVLKIGSPPRGFFPQRSLCRLPNGNWLVSEGAQESGQWLCEVARTPFSTKTQRHTLFGATSWTAAKPYFERLETFGLYLFDGDALGYCFRFQSKYTLDSKRPYWFDSGVLSVLSLENGQKLWRPLVLGSGPFQLRNGFKSQIDVLRHLERSARLAGGTKTDHQTYAQIASGASTKVRT